MAPTIVCLYFLNAFLKILSFHCLATEACCDFALQNKHSSGEHKSGISFNQHCEGLVVGAPSGGKIKWHEKWNMAKKWPTVYPE